MPERTPTLLSTLRLAAIIGLIASLIATAAGLAVLFHFRRGLPSLSRLETIAPPVKTMIFDRNGAPISELFHENRLIIPLEQIPRDIVDAFLVTEDARFHEHWGVSVLDTFRAVLVNIREGRKAQGGSTITQQLARNLFLTHEKAFTRKVKEALLAVEIERRYTKDEILEMYLNQIYFGHGAWGVESAAQLYFGKPARELSLAECSILAGIPKNPSGYSPIRHPEASLGRARVVLELMADAGVITREEWEQATRELQPVSTARRHVREAPYFIEHVRQELLTRYTPETIYGGGLRIHTTLDLRLQHIAEDVLERHLEDMEERQRFPVRHAAADADNDAAKPIDAESMETAYVQGALVAIDPPTGDVLAMVGGRDFADSHFNRAVQAKRQPGSAFKVFVYTAGIENGMTPSDICLDEPITIPIAGSEDYRPRNYDGEFRGDVLVRDALAHSINVPAVRTLLRFGPKATIDCARRLGVTSPLRAVPSLALGSFEVTLLEMTSAFSVYPNGGILASPRAIVRVEDRDGNILEESRPHLTSAIDTRTAYVMTSLLESVVNEGTAAKLRSRGFRGAAAGKTGTPDDYTDGWFVGYTPEIACGAWVGFDRKEKIGEDQTGSKTALPIWADFMAGAGHDDDPPFARPDGLVDRKICVQSGDLATDRCPKTRWEIYVFGTEPSLLCEVHSHGRAAVTSGDPSRLALAPRKYDAGIDPRPTEGGVIVGQSAVRRTSSASVRTQTTRPSR